MYDLFQDKDLNYWITTNNGAYMFDGYDFTPLECDEMISKSLFNLTTDNDGNLYCLNLGGQIFKLGRNTCQLVYEIPDSLITSDIQIYFNQHNELYVRTKHIFGIHPDGSIQTILKDKNNVFDKLNGSVLFKDANERVGVFELINNKHFEISYIENYKSTTNRYEFDGECNENAYFIPLLMNEVLYAFDQGNSIVYKLSGDSIIALENLNIFSKNNLRPWYYDQHFYLPIPTGGYYYFDSTFKEVYPNQTLFNNTIISASIQDNEGNILFGTFNEGIIVIPKTQIKDIALNNSKYKPSKIAVDSNEEIYIGTNQGHILTINKDLKQSVLDTSFKNPIEYLYYSEFMNSLIIGQGTTRLFNLDKNTWTAIKEGVIKDVSTINKHSILLSKSNSVSYTNWTEQVPADMAKNLDEQSKVFNSRTNCSSYDSITNSVYIGATTGLFVKTDGILKKIKVAGKEVFCKDMIYIDGYTYITTIQNGLLVVKNEKIIANWTKDNYLIDNSLNKIKYYDSLLYLNTRKGIQIMNTKGSTKWIIDKSQGLYSEIVLDFAVTENKLWIVHPQGMQRLNMDALQNQVFQPNITISAIHVNDVLISSRKDIKTFAYNKNRISFTLNSKSLRYQKDIVYDYRLIGIDTTWHSNAYHENKIEYKSLPSGNFKFEVRARYQDQYSPIQQYEFKISSPLWQSWWFYFAISLFLILLILYFFSNQIKKQKKEHFFQQQLSATRLTALQAQMNPHFIFNALNSIQDLVLKNNVDSAYTYISKFAQLVRNTLKNSMEDFIEIEEEQNSLELYLLLEKLRFKTNFEYNIDTNNLGEILIPPMLIQPFIENSILHGLMHKDGFKKITISFEMDQQLICIITDNGIGRMASHEINKRQRNNHESFAIKSIIKRLEILESLNEGEFNINYIDLYDNDEPIGTTVILKIPYRKKY